jgi:alpha-ketoglutarate-dependent taurine dioxygenase
VLIKPLIGALGAEVFGLDVRTLNEARLAELQAALIEHQVLALRDQRLEPAALSAFAARLGEREVYPFANALPEDPYVVPVVKEPGDSANFGGAWHSDSSYLPAPPSLTLLYAHTVPGRGGDTLFANMYAAYDALHDDVKRRIEPLDAEFTASLVHSQDGAFAAVAGADRNRREAGDLVTDAIHPLVHRHPQSGRKALFVSLAHVAALVGVPCPEGRVLLDRLKQHAVSTEFCTRLRWAVGTLTIWDNRCTQHYALNDYPGQRRVMYRVILKGEVPQR